MTALLAPPIRPQKLTKWQLVKCNCNINCRGHIVLRYPNNVLQGKPRIDDPQEELFIVGVDIKAWTSMRTRERKKPYTPKSKTKKKTKIFGKFS